MIRTARPGWTSLLAVLSLTLASCGHLTRSEGGSSTAVVPLPTVKCPPVEPRLTPQLCPHVQKPRTNGELRRAYEDLLACVAEANENAREIREQQQACDAVK